MPPEIYTRETLIAELVAIRERGWQPLTRNVNNPGCFGNFLEDLLGIEENNLPLPNAVDWELKTHKMAKRSLLTLFHLEPSPRGMRLATYLLENYGWPRSNGSGSSFRQTIRSGNRSDRGFTVADDAGHNRIIVDFDSSAISQRHSEWKDMLAARGALRMPDTHIPYWGVSDLLSVAESKLRNCFFVGARGRNLRSGQPEARFESIQILTGFRREKFLELLRTGRIFIDFDARSGHNHGTKFRCQASVFPELYGAVEEI